MSGKDRASKRAHAHKKQRSKTPKAKSDPPHSSSSRGPSKGVGNGVASKSDTSKIRTLAVQKPKVADPPSGVDASDSEEKEDIREPSEEAPKDVEDVGGAPPGAGKNTTIRARIKKVGVHLNFAKPQRNEKGEVQLANEYLPDIPFTDVGIHVSSSAHVNPHELSVAYRKLAEVAVLRDLGERTEATLADVYGSRRMAALCEKYGVNHVNGDFGVSYYNDAEKGDRVNLDEMESWGSHALFEDVYHFDENLLREAIKRVSSHTCYLIVRRFVGEVGADAQAEMCWRRVEGMIEAYPDHVNPPYPPHPDTEWLFTGIEGVSVRILVCSGPYYVLRAIPSFARPVLNPALVGSVTKRPICTKMYGALLSDIVQLFGGRWRPKDRTVLVDTVVERQLRVPAYSRPLTGSTQTDLRVTVENLMRKSAWSRKILDHPVLSHLFYEIAEGTWLALMDGTSSYARQMYAIRANQSAEEKLTREARGHLPPIYDALYKRVARNVFRFLSPVFTFATYGAVVIGTPALLNPQYRSVMLTAIRKGLRLLTPGTLFPRFPILSFLGENLGYLVEPRTAVAVGTVELARDGASSALPMHLGKYLLARHFGWTGRLVGVGFHLLWNYMVGCGRAKPLCSVDMELVRSSVADGDRSVCDEAVAPVSLGDNYLTPFNPPEPEWTDHTVGVVRVKFQDGTVVDVNGPATLAFAWAKCVALEERVVKDKYTGVLMLSPSCTVFPVDKNACTTLHAIIGRQMTRPHVHKGAVVDFPAWRKVETLIESTNLWPTEAELNYNVQEFLQQTNNVTRARVLAGFEASQVDGYIPARQSLFVKNDETLAKPRPRAIVSVDPVCQAPLAPVAQALKTVLKEYCPRVWEVAGERVEIWYCSSMVAAELDAMFESIIASKYAIVVAGDDSMVVYNGNVYCNDFSKFDGSRSKSSVRAQLCVFRKLGIPLAQCEQQRKLTCYKYTATVEGVVFTGEVEHMFPTGIVTTTVSNGVDNMSAMAYGVSEGIANKLEPDEAFKLIGRDLGFVLKIRETPCLYQMDFLKGWWVPTTQGLRWINLPSMILKASKVGTTPLHIFRKATKDPDEAFRYLVYSISKCWKGIPREYPVFGAYLSVCDRLGSHIDNPGAYRAGIVENAEYKVWTRVTDIVVSVVFDMIAKRYGVEVSDVMSLDSMIRGIDTLPCYIAHPVLDAMLRVDYL